MPTFTTEIEDYLDWMRVHNYARTTIGDRRRLLGYFANFARCAGVHEPQRVNGHLVVDYQRHLHLYRKANGSPLSVATQVQRLVPLTQFFTWLRREHRIKMNPTVDLLMPRPNRQLPEATLSALEMARLMSAPLVTRPLGLRDRAVLEVFYSSALRRSELLALRVPDVDFERGTLFVRRGKGAKDRFVPVGERALFWVRLYLGLVRPRFCADRATDTLFVSSLGTPICADWLCRKVHAYLTQVDIHKRGSCHLLRHSVATLMLEGGADIRYVAELLGPHVWRPRSAIRGSRSTACVRCTPNATPPPASMWQWHQNSARSFRTTTWSCYTALDVEQLAATTTCLGSSALAHMVPLGSNAQHNSRDAQDEEDRKESQEYI